MVEMAAWGKSVSNFRECRIGNGMCRDVSIARAISQKISLEKFFGAFFIYFMKFADMMDITV